MYTGIQKNPNEKTTPEIRKDIYEKVIKARLINQEYGIVKKLMYQYGISRGCVYKWVNRGSETGNFNTLPPIKKKKKLP